MNDSTALRRVIRMLAVLTLLITLFDVGIHHHFSTPLLPEFGQFSAISLIGCGLLIIIGRCLAALLSRKDDYYER